MMCGQDIAQVTEIDREAFPTMLPPVNYRHELKNRLAHYIIAGDKSKTVDITEAPPIPEQGFSGLTAKVRHLFNHNRFFGDEQSVTSTEYVAGFAGFWIMADEAHLISIAVRDEYRRQGIGELLLISVIDLATELKVKFITLEVRVSNLVAQRLYRKFGFVQVGLRRSYYSDNREDGVLMTAENVNSASFQARLQRLKRAHSKKWGIALYEVVR